MKKIMKKIMKEDGYFITIVFSVIVVMIVEVGILVSIEGMK